MRANKVIFELEKKCEKLQEEMNELVNMICDNLDKRMAGKKPNHTLYQIWKFAEQLKQQMKTREEMKHKKYWYRIEVRCCVLCGRENKNKERVFDKNRSGTFFYDDACQNHFI